MGVYDRQIASAKRQIAAKGQNVTWRQVVNGHPADPAKDWKPGPAVKTDNDVRIAFFNGTRENEKTLSYRKDTAISGGFLLGYMAAVDFTPTIKDVVIRDGKELIVKDFDELNVNGESILFTVEFEQ